MTSSDTNKGTTMNATKSSNAVAELIAAGAVKERREDRHGDTKAGWWLDGVWLAPATQPQAAVAAMKGGG